MALTLIIGGARSGKSELAQRLAAASGAPVTFIATMEPLDDEVRRRIDIHRAARPAAWRTIEEPLDVAEALANRAGSGDCALIDCLTLWIANILMRALGDSDRVPASSIEAAIEAARTQVDRLVQACDERRGPTIIVSNEVGLGVVPPYPLGRAFRDAMGAANARVATRAARVLQCTAGLVLDLRAAGAVPIAEFAADTGA